VSKKKQAAAKKPERILYVEGGGDHNSILGSQCRKAFSKLFEKAEVIDRPTVRPKGGRVQAFRAFYKELTIGKNHTWLLVDADELAPALKPGETANPWAHVKARDQWDKPSGATDEQLHLMSVTMETWLVCDREALRKQCSQINATKLPAVNRSLEAKSKEAINKALDDAFSSTSAKKYSKGFSLVQNPRRGRSHEAAPYALLGRSLSAGDGSAPTTGRIRINGAGPCTSVMTVITAADIDRLGFNLSRRGGVPLNRDGEINR
jgi:hypothetical protein